MDKSDIPKIIHKYISLFDNEEAYNAAFSNFEEVNWSAIKPSVGSEETPDKYRASRRLSNMYRKNNPPSYKFDNIDDFVLGNKQVVEIQDDETKKLVIKETKIYADAAYIAKHNTNGNIINNFTPDTIRKTFFLEIIWGIFGWEWHDYERIIGINEETREDIIEVLKGGNLYKIKEVKTVPHIIDGYRLQHINDLLNSQNKVTKVEGFNTSNIIAANRAFKRIDLVRTWDDVLECHFVDGYTQDGDFGNHPFGYANPITGENLLENLLEADGIFYNNKIYMYEGDFLNTIPITIPNIESIDRFYSYGAYTDGLQFKMPSLITFTNAFKMAMFNKSNINFNNILIGDTLKRITNFNGFLAGVSIYDTESDNHTVNLDLTSSLVDSATQIDLSHFAEWIGPRDYGHRVNDGRNIIADSVINISLNFKNPVDLSYGFANISRNKYITYDGQSNIGNNGYSKINLNLNSKEAYVRSLDYAFINNIFANVLQIDRWLNPNCSENYIYQGSTFNVSVEYDFSPTNTINEFIGQFNDCTFNVQHSNGYFADFDGCDAVKNFTFENVKFGDNVNKIFPYTIHSVTLYDENTKYRNISFKGSQISKLINNSVLYLDYCTDAKYWKSSGRAENNLNPFFGCANVDFADNRLDIYYKDRIYSQQPIGGENRTIFNFTGNKAMTVTPHIHMTIDAGTGYDGLMVNFSGTQQNPNTVLEVINFEDFEIVTPTATGANNGRFNCAWCTSLETFKVATNSSFGWRIFELNFDHCVGLSADTTNLVASISKLVKIGQLVNIPRSVIGADNSATWTAIRNHVVVDLGGTLTIDENN